MQISMDTRLSIIISNSSLTFNKLNSNKFYITVLN